MTQSKKKFVQDYIDRLNNELSDFNASEPEGYNQAERDLFDTILEIRNIFSKDLPQIEDAILINSGSGVRDAKSVLGILKLYLISEDSDENNDNSFELTNPLTEEKQKPNSVSKEELDAINKKVFVVHGRNMKIRNAMFDFLEAIGLEPMEWDEIRDLTGKGAPTIGELLDVGFTRAYAIIVLFTPDEVAKLNEEFISKNDNEYERNLTPQARPNVLFEAGMAMGYNPNRTILVEVGKLRPFSDIAGINCIRLSNTPESRASLRGTLKTIGLSIKEAGTRWLTAGDFNLSNAGSISLEINLSNATEFWHPDGVSHSTLIREEANEYFAKLLLDFIEHKPLYVGYAVKLGNKDWTSYYDNDKAITFTVIGTPEIKNIILEVKGENKNIIAKRKITVTNNGRTYKFKLKDLSDSSDEFAKMTELVFLFTSENINGNGNVEISNLMIT